MPDKTLRDQLNDPGASFAAPMAMEKLMKHWNDVMPKVDPTVLALASNPTLIAIAEQQRTIADQLPRIAPEFMETLSKLQEMHRQFKNLPQFKIPFFETTNGHRLLEAALRVSASYQHLDNWWPKMRSFQFDGENALLADIDLEPVTSDAAQEMHPPIIEETGRIKRIITDIFKDDQNLIRLEPHTFEEVIAELLRAQGFTVDLTKRTRDGGYDLIAISLHAGFPLKFLVECKRYTKEGVGIDIVRSLMYVVEQEKANKGIIATTSYFTRDVREHQRSAQPYQLDLRDKNDILGWIRQYGEEKLQLFRPKA